MYTNLYKVIYAANIVLQYVGDDSEVKLRARAEAKVFRAMSYIELISLWGTPPLVDHPLKANEYSQANGNTEALWALVNQDLTEAVNSGNLEEKTSLDNFTYRITKQFAQALLGKAYVFQKNYGAAVTVLDEVINSGKYDLYSDYENIQTTKGEANCESLFESNYVYDANNVTGIMSNMIGYMCIGVETCLHSMSLLKSILMEAGDFLIRRRKATMRLSKWEILIG